MTPQDNLVPDMCKKGHATVLLNLELFTSSHLKDT